MRYWWETLAIPTEHFKPDPNERPSGRAQKYDAFTSDLFVEDESRAQSIRVAAILSLTLDEAGMPMAQRSSIFLDPGFSLAEVFFQIEHGEGMPRRLRLAALLMQPWAVEFYRDADQARLVHYLFEPNRASREMLMRQAQTDFDEENRRQELGLLFETRREMDCQTRRYSAKIPAGRERLTRGRDRSEH